MSKYVISSSPHLRDNVSTTSIMRDVALRCCPLPSPCAVFRLSFGAHPRIVCRGCGFKRVVVLQGHPFPQHDRRFQRCRDRYAAGDEFAEHRAGIGCL